MSENALICSDLVKRRFARDLEAIREVLKAKGESLDILEAKSKEELIGFASQVGDSGVKNLFVAGGDGTLHLAVQGIMKSQADKPILVPIPFGTGNDFYRGFRKGRFQASWLEGDGEVRSMSLGRVGSEDETIRYFLNSFSFGITPKILERYESLPLRNYLLPTIWSLLDYRSLPLTLDRGLATESAQTLIFMICKGPYAGGGMRFHPDAKHESPQVIWVPKLPVAQSLRHVPKLYREGLPGVPGVKSFAFRDLSLNFLEEQNFLELDGEIVAVPKKIQVSYLANAIRIKTY